MNSSDPPRSSEMPGNRERVSTGSRVLETSVQPTFVGLDSRTNRVEQSESLEARDSGHEKEKKEMGWGLVEVLKRQLDATLTGGRTGEKEPTLDTLEALQSMVRGTPDIGTRSGGQKHVEELAGLGVTAYKRFEDTQNVTDINEAIEYWETAFALSLDTPEGVVEEMMDRVWTQRSHDTPGSIYIPGYKPPATSSGLQTARLGILSNLGCAYESRFNLLGELSDLSKAIESQAKVVVLTPEGHPGRSGFLHNLGVSYETRFRRLGELLDLDKAIKFKARAVELGPDGHVDVPVLLDSLGISYWTKFKRMGELSDLNKAIESQGRAVSLIPDGRPDKPRFLSNLGSSYESRFRRLDELPDLSKAIEFKEQAVLLTADAHPNKPGFLNNLGVSYRTRFRRQGELLDLNKAIKSQAQAVSLTLDGRSNKPGFLNNFGVLYWTRFRSLGELSDLDKAIESQVQAISLTSDDHPDKPAWLNNLGVSYKARFIRLGELSDLHKLIEFQVKAVLLTPEDHPDRPGRLHNLGGSYETRFGRLGKQSDLNQAIEYKARAVSLTPVDHPNRPGRLNDLGVSYGTKFRRLGELSDLDKAIESQMQAVWLAPDTHPDRPACLNGLGVSYRTRFGRLGELPDLNKAIESQAQAVLLSPDDGHIEKPGRLNNLGVSYQSRFERLGEISDLNKAIESKARAVSLTPDGHPDKSAYLNNLGNSYETRFGRLGERSDLNKAIEYQVQAVSLTPDDHPNAPAFLNALGFSHKTRFGCLGDLSDVNRAIEFQALSVELTPDGHSDKPERLNNLACSYETRFKRLGEPSDLERAIDSKSQAVSLTPDGHPLKSAYLNNLGNSYKSRFETLGEYSDMESAASLFRSAARSPAGPPSVRFRACRQLARLSSFDTSSPPHSAYNYAMQLLPQLIWVGTTLDRRYELIAEVGDFATEAASHAISLAAYDLALEWLEAARSIVWSQITRFRTPFDQLAAHDPELADQLEQVGCKLEQAGSRLSSLREVGDDDRDLGREANSHIELALSWDKLLTKARSIPSFEDFLRSPKSSQLMGVAKDGPIVVISAHQSRCDALVLQPDTSTISHVPLTAFSHDIATSAREHLASLVGPRGLKKLRDKSGLDAKLEESLTNLWVGVVKPVLDHLGFIRGSPSDPLPHVTWCTTGLLSFLPLHAAGCYDQPKSCTFDHVISSYTPTLGALLSNQSRPTVIPRGVVAVGQERTPGLSDLPCVNDELGVIKRHAHDSVYLQLENDKATVQQVLDAMNQFNWVHMACHGTQNTADPTKSAFHLHDGPLTLATITKQSFTNKGLAFLSACQTATGDENMPDEAVHLAAGMLMAGYPSVIGTMWSIEDKDGPEIAGRVYEELLKDGTMDHTKAAWALHQAVGELRAKVGTQDIGRWAPFIHIGS